MCSVELWEELWRAPGRAMESSEKLSKAPKKSQTNASSLITGERDRDTL